VRQSTARHGMGVWTMRGRYHRPKCGAPREIEVRMIDCDPAVFTVTVIAVFDGSGAGTQQAPRTVA